MVARHPLLQKCLLSTTTATPKAQQRWSVKEVTKSNFNESLIEELKNHIKDSDFIAISSQKTGSFGSAPWRRILPFVDTPETAYLKAKDAAERFQILQLMVCPFSLQSSTSTSNPKLIAHPYNFHLFPRDELNIGMPSYSFSCQTSSLTYMARQGFDFNRCIYDGISYLSRVQESAAKHRLGNPVSDIHAMKSSSPPSVADTLFKQRIKSRLVQWRNACRDKNKDPDEALIRSLRKLILGGETYGSRPCMSIDVCSEQQVQLILEILSDFPDDVVPLIIPEKGGGPKSVRVVLASSQADKDVLQTELQDLEEKQNKKVRGFREVIDVISASQKPVVTYNCLNELPFIHSKFLGPLPPSMKEFMCSLRLSFPNILDVDHLIKEIGPLKKAKSIPAALSYIKRQFFVPIDMEISPQALGEGGKVSGHNVLYTAFLFSKLSAILKKTPDTQQNMKNGHVAASIYDYANIFSPCATNLEELLDGENVMMGNTRKVSTKDLVFLWGFKTGMSAGVLKSFLRGTHDMFSEDFEVRLVDKSCAIVVFWKPNSAETLLEVMATGADGHDALRELISNGVRTAGYEAYKRICKSGFGESDLADSFDKVLAEVRENLISSDSNEESLEVCWSGDSINLDEL